MAGFDLSSVLKDVSDLNTEEQLVKIELDKLDPDPENFYSLDGLDELAGNIETVGLQQPLRVRPGEGGHFIVVSGHRRRAACMLIRDGGSKQFEGGVPCIVEYGEASAALRKLRLIYANSSTRQLTSAEQSRQAEEVTRLLYELKEQGVEFPGRMRDHVAEACQLSKTKIARLHAIRENLIQELLRHWDAGEIKEETAYQLSRFPAEIQQLVTEHMAKPNVTRWPYADSLRAVLEDKEKYKLFACPAKSGAQCSNLDTKILKNVFSYSWEMCSPGKCCLDCANSGRSCSAMCPAARDRVKLNKAVEAEKAEKAKAEAESRKEIQQKALRKEAARLLALAERAGLPDSACIGSYGKGKVSELRAVVAGKAEANKWQLQPYDVDEARAWARKLKCTAGELLGDKPPKPAADPAALEPAWQTGRPKRAGRYLVRVKHKTISTMEQRMYFDPDLDELNCWRLFGAPLGAGAEILGWWPLPEEVTEK